MKKLANIFITLLILTLAGCSFFAKEDLIELGANGKVNLQLSINEYEGTETSARTILPAQEDGTDVSKYVLTGTLHGGTDTVNESWSSYSAMVSDTLEVTQGTWDFTLSAYKTEGGTEKLFAKGTLTKALSITQIESLSFSLSFAENALTTGALSVKVSVPYGLVNKVNVSLYSYNGGTKSNVFSRDYTVSGGAPGGTSSFNIKESSISNGFYYLQMDFYTDNSAVSTSTRVQNVKIAGGQTSKATISYTDDLNKKYTIIFNPQLPATETYSIPYTELGYNSSTKITLPGSSDCTADHYDFAGWYDNSSYTGSAITDWAAGERTGEVNLFAKWTPRTYDVALYDFGGGQATGKSYSGNVFATTLVYGSKLPVQTDIQISDPNTTQYNNYDNVLYFAGWCKEPSCETFVTNADYLSLQDLDNDGISDTFVLYAKWNYKYVFIKPSGGANTNKGASANEPLASITEVKTYLENNPKAEKVYVQSGLSIEANNPSGLTTPKYNNVIVEGYYSYTGHIISVSTVGEYDLHDVTLDGGAVWGEDGAAGVNNGRSATIALISLFTGSNTAILNLNDNVVLQNNQNTDATNHGGAIRNYDIVKLNSKSVVIRANASTTHCGGGIHLGSGASLYLNKGIIGGTDLKDGNYAVNGGAIGVSNHTADGNIYVGTEGLSNIDRSDILIMNNSAKYGGAVYLSESSATVKNATIKNNSTTYSSGGAFFGDATVAASELHIENSLINYNTALSQGGAINICVPLFIDNCEFSHNTSKGGSGGGAIFINNTTSTISNSVFSYNEHTSKLGGAIVVSTNSTLTLSNSTFDHNKAGTFGGVLYAGSTSSSTNDTSTTITNCTFTENESLQEGGAISIRTNAASGYKNILKIADSTFTKNKALEKGGAINSVGLTNEVTITNVLLEKNDITTASPNTGKDFYTDAQVVNVGGKNYLGNAYLDNSQIKLISPITKYSDKSVVMTVGIPSDKYPITSYDASDSSTYVKILNEDSGAGYIASSYKLFGVEKANYKVNDAGYIVTTQPMMNPNGGVSFADDEITFELSESRIKPDEENNINVTITQFKNTASERILTNADFTDFAITVYSNGREITSTPYITVDNAAQKVTVRDVPEGQNLVIHVTMKYNGKAYGGSFNMKVESDNSISLADFSAYLTTLPAGEHNIPLNADMSDATNVQALAAALEAYPDRIVNLDLTSSTFTEFAGAASSTDAYFKDVINLKSVSLPATVTSINKYAFCGCSELTSIDIPSSVTEIGDVAFKDCTGLASIDIPSSVTSIGTSAFSGCTDLTSIEIPSSVTSLGLSAFYNCTGLTSIEIYSSITSLGWCMFSGCTELTSIEIPSSVTSLGSGVFQNCTGLISITIPSSVTSIEGAAFSGCTNLISAVFEDTVSSWTINGSTFTPTNDTAANATELVTNSNKTWTKN